MKYTADIFWKHITLRILHIFLGLGLNMITCHRIKPLQTSYIQKKHQHNTNMQKLFVIWLFTGWLMCSAVTMLTIWDLNLYIYLAHINIVALCLLVISDLYFLLLCKTIIPSMTESDLLIWDNHTSQQTNKHKDSLKCQSMSITPKTGLFPVISLLDRVISFQI